MKHLLSLFLLLSVLVFFSSCIGAQPSAPADADSPQQSNTQPAASGEITSGEPSAPVPVAPDYNFYEGDFELPVYGASGAAVTALYLRSSPGGDPVDIIPAGGAFMIISDNGDGWLFAVYKDKRGYLPADFCMINLPDVIPSVIYDNSNSYSSIYVTSGKSIPGITGKKLYNSIMYSDRFCEDRYVMCCLYSTAKKICAAQQQALSEGYSLKIYEAFRPYETQMKTYNAVLSLAYDDPDVLAGISTYPYSMVWFIAYGVSSHQLGIAMDTSLVKVTQTDILSCGDYSYTHVAGYEECVMQSAMHELSIASCVFEYPISLFSSDGVMLPGVTDDAKTLQRLCMSAGFTPLSSEWWHFNDNDAYASLGDASCGGDFIISECISLPPTALSAAGAAEE